jgi:hypothetical protein
MEMSDIEKARLDRLEEHQKLFKNKLDDVADDVRDIKTAIMGSPLTSDEGLSSKMKRVERDVKDLEDFKTEVNTYVKQFKYMLGVIFVALVTMITKIFNP